MNNSLAQQKKCAQVLTNFQSKRVVSEKDLSLILQEVYPNIVKPFLVNNQIDFGVRNILGRSILHVLAGRGYVEAVDLLLRLKKGIIPVHAQDEYGRTVLHEIIDNYIMIENLLEVVKLLLADGRMDVNAQDKKGWTVLHSAVDKNNLEVVKLLLENDRINVNATVGRWWWRSSTLYRYYRYTALHLAVIKNYPEIVEILLKDDRIDMNVGDEYGVTALDIAIKKDYNEIKELLLEASQRVLQPNDGVTL